MPLILAGTLSAGARKLAALPYAWGAQPVAALGLVVFTDGDDILAIPLEVSGLVVQD